MRIQSISLFSLVAMSMTLLSLSSCFSSRESSSKQEKNDPVPHFAKFRNTDASKRYRGGDNKKLIAWLETYKPSRKIVRSLLGKDFYEQQDYDVYGLGVSVIDFDELHIKYDSNNKVVSAKYVQG